jgi:hypothetical protein
MYRTYVEICRCGDARSDARDDRLGRFMATYCRRSLCPSGVTIPPLSATLTISNRTDLDRRRHLGPQVHTDAQRLEGRCREPGCASIPHTRLGPDCCTRDRHLNRCSGGAHSHGNRCAFCSKVGASNLFGYGHPYRHWRNDSELSRLCRTSSVP